MPDQTSIIISKVWGMCNPLRDNGVSYGDYLEQLTYLIFLKMSDEYSKPPYKRETGIPAGYAWADMNTLKGAELEEQYKATLEKLGGAGRHFGKDFQGCGEQNQQRRHPVPHRADDRSGALGVHVLRRQGRDLRGPAPEKRGGCEKRCRTVFHTPAPHSGYGTLRPPRTDENRCRPLLRQWRFFPGRPRVHRESGPLCAGSGTKGIPEKPNLPRQ